jgi:hypothetical protein
MVGQTQQREEGGGHTMNGAAVSDFTAEGFMSGWAIRGYRVADLMAMPPASCQRPVSPSKVRRLEAKWDWDAYDPIQVNVRPDGTETLVDGQHRAVTINQKFGNILVPCKVSFRESPQSEAMLWVTKNTFNPTPQPLEIFRGIVEAQDKDAISILKVLEETGFELLLEGAKASQFQLRSPGTLLDIYRKDGEEGLRSVLTFARSTWCGQKDVASAWLLKGVSNFIRLFSSHPNFSLKAVSKALEGTSLSDIQSDATDYRNRRGGSSEKACAYALQDRYNKSVRGRSKKVFEP